MNVFQFILELHGFLQFLLLCATYYLLKFVIFVVPNRIMRTIKVCKRGWPPPHLDADGDWKPEEDKEDTTP